MEAKGEVKANKGQGTEVRLWPFLFKFQGNLMNAWGPLSELNSWPLGLAPAAMPLDGQTDLLLRRAAVRECQSESRAVVHVE